MESRSTARICSPSALHIERSPECRRATSSASRCARENSAQIPSRLIGAVSMMRAPFGQYSSKARGTSEPAYKQTGERAIRSRPPQGDEIGSARPRADEVNGHGSLFTILFSRLLCHGSQLPAMAQLAPPLLMRLTSRTEEGPAPASAAVSALDGSPNSAIPLGEFVAARKEACRKTWPSRKTSGRPSAFAASAKPGSFFLASCVKRPALAPVQDAAAKARPTSAMIASDEQPLLQPMPIATAGSLT